jgi:hypothetical protein
LSPFLSATNWFIVFLSNSREPEPKKEALCDVWYLRYR